jgi:hypothetical protein
VKRSRFSIDVLVSRYRDSREGKVNMYTLAPYPLDAYESYRGYVYL